MAKAIFTQVIFDQLTLSADRETMEGYADFCGLDYDENTTDAALALLIAQTVEAYSDADWDSCEEALQGFVNDCIEQAKAQLKAKPKKPAAAAKKPAAKKKPAPKSKPAPAAAATEAEAAVTAEDIDGCRTKKALAELTGLELTAKSLTAQKNEAKKALGLVKPVRANAGAKEPSKAELQKAKTAARASANDNANKDTEKGKMWKPGSNADIIYQAACGKKKGGYTMDEIVANVQKQVDAGKIKCANVPGRVKHILQVALKREILVESGGKYSQP